MYSYMSLISFNLDAKIVKENCQFQYYYNISPTQILDGVQVI